MTDTRCSPDIEQWIKREFAGHGVAVRREEDAPIPGEPLMSMADAKDLIRRAVAEFTLQPATPTGGEEVCTCSYCEAHRREAARSSAGTDTLRTFDTTGTVFWRTGRVLTITCDSAEIANRVADQLRTPTATGSRG